MIDTPAVLNQVASRGAVARALLTALARQAGQPLVLLGDPGPVLDGAPTDIDIAIGVQGRRDRGLLVRGALDQLPWPARILQVIQHEAHAHYFAVAVFVGERWELFHPDFTTDYVRDGRTLIGFEKLVDGARQLDGIAGVSLPEPGTAAHYYVVKRVSKGSITQAGIDYLGDLLEAEATAVRHAVTTLLGERLAATVLAALEARNTASFHGAARAARPELYARYKPKVKERLAEAGRAVRRVLEPTGAAIAIYGTDGSGKGTLLAALRCVVGPAFRAVDEWHLFARVRPGEEDVPVTDPHGMAARSSVVSAVKLAYYLVLAWLRRGPRIAVARRRARLVLLDRDVEDLWIDPRRYRFSLPAGVLRFAVKLFPRPDLGLVLHADSATILNRSRELDANTLEHLARRYRAYGEARPNVKLIDASVAADEVVLAATTAVFDWLEERTTRRLGLAPAMLTRTRSKR